MTPPMEVPWPPMNLVAEWTTISAPNSMGRHRYGVAKVLSIISGMPRFVGDRGDALDVDHVHARIRHGLDIDHLRLLGDRVAEIVEVVRVDEDRVVSEPAEGRVELGYRCRRTGGGRRDDFVAALAQASRWPAAGRPARWRLRELRCRPRATPCALRTPPSWGS